MSLLLVDSAKCYALFHLFIKKIFVFVFVFILAII